MSNQLTKLARKNVQELTPYQSARRIGGSGDIWLNANEAPDSGHYALDCNRLNRYPEFQPTAVINGYADYAGVNPENVITTRGADEAIELLIRTFCEPGVDNILINPPTYGMYEVSAETCGVSIIKQDLDANFDPDYDAITAKLDSVKIVFLCAPNNPTGNLLDSARLTDLLNAAKDKAIIVCDEAYIEFCPAASQVSLLQDFDNLVILRTLSKAFALASLRCGFAIASETVIGLLSKVIPPYPVPEPVAQIASQALTASGIEIMTDRVAQLNGMRSAFIDELNQLTGVEKVFPATGNYVLVQFNNSQKVFSLLGEQGIVLRDFSSKARLENCIRITLGNAAEMNSTLAALKSVLS
ncbi:histidinol-phosphate transaminase [Moritella marina ATCC 15381]|uniref:Histidinol-phosphate aminotransferase n=1 Tax=Moritella marina ATCC 15381 TaxID=1202962 RepID=A0A5J6WHD1_MORMI|nr:histidinol-phosphate transaminase [Moritella marina]QFI37509.1 histidinol-phosphate transaminase [Moritella marina ATCC 15381]